MVDKNSVMERTYTGARVAQIAAIGVYPPIYPSIYDLFSRFQNNQIVYTICPHLTKAGGKGKILQIPS